MGSRISLATRKINLPVIALSLLAGAATGAVSAHGGISAIGALLPLYVGLFVMSIALLIWIVYSLLLYSTKPGELSVARYNGYRYFSYVFIFLLLLLLLFGMLFLGGVVVLILIPFVVVSTLTALNVARAGKILAAQSADES